MQEQWQSKLGFIRATVGAAVGLGSIWRFACVVGENGGAAFLIVYMVMILLIRIRW
jgi:neurotransmitter:Na+ symporter, NSS family